MGQLSPWSLHVCSDAIIFRGFPLSQALYCVYMYILGLFLCSSYYQWNSTSAQLSSSVHAMNILYKLVYTLGWLF